MDFHSLIADYGYWALFIGSFLEGETPLLIGGFLAHTGHLKLFYVMLFAGCGSFLGDQLYYYLGRYRGMSYIDSKPMWKKRADVIYKYLHRHPVLFILSFRFLYGLRTVSPFMVGASGYPPLRYSVLNIMGVIIWAVVIGCFGYYLGHFAEQFLSDIQSYEFWILGMIILLAASYWLYRHKKIKKETGLAIEEKEKSH